MALEQDTVRALRLAGVLAMRCHMLRGTRRAGLTGVANQRHMLVLHRHWNVVQDRYYSGAFSFGMRPRTALHTVNTNTVSPSWAGA